MKRWHVIYTHSRGESRALWHLRNQGFKCFLPRCRTTKRHARKVYESLEPLFPRYLFVQFDPCMSKWRSINGSRGVVELITDGLRPLSIPNGVVEELLAESDNDGVAPLSVLGMFWAGRMVRIKTGPFTGQTAEVVEAIPDASDRVQILLSMLGAQFRVPMPAHALDAV